MGSVHSILCAAADDQNLYAVAFEHGEVDNDLVLLRSPPYPKALSSNKWDIVKRYANNFIPDTPKTHHHCAASKGAFLILSDANKPGKERFRGFIYDPVGTKGEFKKVHAGDICEKELWCQARVNVVPGSSPPRFSMLYYHESFDAIKMASFDALSFTFSPASRSSRYFDSISSSIFIHIILHIHIIHNVFNNNINNDNFINLNHNLIKRIYHLKYINIHTYNGNTNPNNISSQMAVITADSAIDPMTNAIVPRLNLRVFGIDDRGLPVPSLMKSNTSYLLPEPCTNNEIVDRFGRASNGALYYWCNGSNGTLYTIEKSSISDPLELEPWYETPNHFVVAPTRGDKDPTWALVTDTWGSIYGVQIKGSDAGELLSDRPTTLRISLSTGTIVHLGIIGLMILSVLLCFCTATRCLRNGCHNGRVKTEEADVDSERGGNNNGENV
ncbi:hypothetical protein BGZ73_008360 [Actinomortierella ambigua]|nr:hypothetical protein BGZ73_008360 [Actinomortierella ambigua]